MSVAPGAGGERHFFDAFWDDSFAPGDRERYHRHFPRAPGHIAGEWTPRYMHDVWTPALLALCAPEAKLLVSLRDPLERYRSQLRSAFGGPGGVNAFPGGLAAVALARSLYADPLLRVLAHFDRGQVLVLQMEGCVAEPGEQLQRTLRFLGLDPDFEPAEPDARVNEGPAGVELPAALEAEISGTFAHDARRLVELFPDLDLSLWPSVRDAA